VSRDKVQKPLQLSKENVKWLMANYPKTSVSYIVDNLLTKFREAHTNTINDFMKLGAEALRVEISSGGQTSEQQR
jgi:hypothetical protein